MMCCETKVNIMVNEYTATELYIYYPLHCPYCHKDDMVCYTYKGH